MPLGIKVFMKKEFASRAGVSLLIVTVVVTVALSFQALQQIDQASIARNNAFVLLNRADVLLTEIIDAETGQRGFLLTDDEVFLEAYLAVCDSVKPHVQDLRKLSTTPAAHAHLDSLSPMIDTKLAYFSKNIALNRNHDASAVLVQIRGSQGKPLMDSIRSQIGAFSQIEQRALAKHEANFQGKMRRLFVVIVVASLLVLLLALAFAYILYGETRKQLQSQALLESQRLLAIQDAANKTLLQTNRSLQISEERLAVTLSSIGDAVLTTDASARIVLLNPVAQELTGWTMAEAMLKPIEEVFTIINESTRLPVAIPVTAALAHGTIQGLANHTILIARDGREYSIDDSCAPIRDRSGIVVGTVLVFRNITERREIEQGLETTRKELAIIKDRADEASEFSQSLINTLREPLLTLDHDLRVVSVSRSFYDFFKVQPDETIGELIYDLGNKQWDIPKLRELLETILPQKTSFDNYEVEHVFTTIGRRIMLLNARQILRGIGKERIILLAIEDITERKSIADKLQKTSQELERIVQAQSVVITDTQESLNHETQGRIYEEGEVSHRQEALEAVYAMETGIDADIETLYDQIVLSIASVLRSPSVAIDEYRNNKIIRGSLCLDNCVSRTTVPIEPCFACKKVLVDKHPCQFSGDLLQQFNGDLCFDATRFHAFAGVPINGPQGEIFGVIHVLDDLPRIFSDTEIQFVETFGRYIAHELSRRGLEFRLHHAEEMRLLGQLTSGVAHEVRNPLNGILAIMGALSKELADNERFEPYMKHMRNQITRLTGLMDDLLSIGRPLREESSHEVSMVTLVENALSTWHQTQETDTLNVRLMKPEANQMCMIMADSAYMTQIIINLLENARNHSVVGSEILCTVQMVNDTSIIFSVKDCGSGIAPDILPRIFDPFFTARKGGTGLGLCIVRNIVENHKGRITAFNNSDGPGATFEVVFPVYRSPIGS